MFTEENGNVPPSIERPRGDYPTYVKQTNSGKKLNPRFQHKTTFHYFAHDCKYIRMKTSIFSFLMYSHIDLEKYPSLFTRFPKELRTMQLQCIRHQSFYNFVIEVFYQSY